MLYRVFFEDGSEELVEASGINDARGAVEGYGSDVTKIVALGDCDDEDDDFDDEDFAENPDEDDDEGE